MMKRITAVLLLLCMLMFTAAQAEETANAQHQWPFIPEDAVFLFTGMDDGISVHHYLGADDTAYEVEVHPITGDVMHIEIDTAKKRGGKTVVLTQEEAEKAVTTLYPDAVVTFSKLDRDDGRYVYEVEFDVPDFRGKIELNAETGAMLECRLSYAPSVKTAAAEGPMSAEQAKTFVLSLVENGRLTDFDVEHDDGLTVYEGEIIADGLCYEFTIDAATGRVIEWQADD